MKNLPASAGDAGHAGSGLENPLEKEMATHSSILAWKCYGHRSLGGYRPWGRKESSTTEHTHRKTGRNTHTHTHIFNFHPGVIWVAVQKHRFPVFLLQGRSILLYPS